MMKWRKKYRIKDYDNSFRDDFKHNCGENLYNFEIVEPFSMKIITITEKEFINGFSFYIYDGKRYWSISYGICTIDIVQKRKEKLDNLN